MMPEDAVRQSSRGRRTPLWTYPDLSVVCGEPQLESNSGSKLALDNASNY